MRICELEENARRIEGGCVSFEMPSDNITDNYALLRTFVIGRGLEIKEAYLLLVIVIMLVVMRVQPQQMRYDT